MPGQEQQGAQEEDVELKDIVTQTLETRGVLSKMRAQIRAAVFLALEDEAQQRNKLPVVNQELKAVAASREGSLMLALVYDFLHAYELEFTQSVFSQEIGASQQQPEHSRGALLRQLGLGDVPTDKRHPVLLEVVRRLTHSDAVSTRAGASAFRPENSFSEELAAESRTKPDPPFSSPPKVPVEHFPASKNDSDSPQKTGEFSLTTLKDAPPLFGKKSETAIATEAVSPTKKAAESATEKSQPDASLSKAFADADKKKNVSALSEKRLDDADADDNTEYKDDFEESVRSESLGPGVTSPPRPAYTRQRSDLSVDGDAEEVDDEVIEIGEDEQSRSSEGNFRVRERDDGNSYANDPSVNSDRSLGLDYVEDVVSQH